MSRVSVTCRFTEGRIAVAEGYEVVLAGILPAVAHRALKPDGSLFSPRSWVVTEPTTGHAVCSPRFRTREEAVRAATENVESGGRLAISGALADAAAQQARAGGDPEFVAAVLERSREIIDPLLPRHKKVEGTRA